MYASKLHVLTLMFVAINCLGQEGKPLINIDSLVKVRVLDYQNFNYDRFYGRTYEISKHQGKYRMELVEQFGPRFTEAEERIIASIDTIDTSGKEYWEVVKVLMKDLPDSTKDRSPDLAYKLIWRNQLLGIDSEERVLIDTFQPGQLLRLVEVINDRKSSFANKIASNLGMGPEWVNQNASRLFETYKLPDIDPTDEERAYCLSCFLDKRKLMLAAYTLRGSHNSSDYPFVEMQFISEGDTLNMQTDYPNPLSIPWLLEDSTKNFNPQISLLLAEMLPDLLYSNKERLAAANFERSTGYKSFEEMISKRLINMFCTEIRGKKKRMKRSYVLKDKTARDRDY